MTKIKAVWEPVTDNFVMVDVEKVPVVRKRLAQDVLGRRETKAERAVRREARFLQRVFKSAAAERIEIGRREWASPAHIKAVRLAYDKQCGVVRFRDRVEGEPCSQA